MGSEGIGRRGPRRPGSGFSRWRQRRVLRAGSRVRRPSGPGAAAAWRARRRARANSEVPVM